MVLAPFEKKMSFFLVVPWLLHGCTIEDGALIGIQAVVLNGAVIGKNCLVAPEHSSQKERFFLITLSFLVPPQK